MLVTRHPLRGKHPKMVFLSVAGFPEDEIFDPLSAWAQFVYGRTGAVVAEIYRPAAETMVGAYFKGKADGQQTFMEQKYTVDGDLSLLLRMNEFFGQSQ